MGSKHIHHDLIIAWAEGADIQWWDKKNCKWKAVAHPSWTEDIKYRLTPPPSKEVLVHMYRYKDGTYMSRVENKFSWNAEQTHGLTYVGEFLFTEKEHSC